MTTDPASHRKTTDDGPRCNACGYTLVGLGEGDDCPECGRPVARSMPDARRGSAWQRGRPLGALLDPVRRPNAMWEDVRPERPLRSLTLLVFVCLVAAAPMVPSLLVGGAQVPGAHPLYALTFALSFALVLMALSLVEGVGLRVIGWRHGWSRSAGHVLAVVAHASPGWIVSGVLCALAWQVLQRIPGAWSTGRLVIDGQQVLPDGSWVGLAMALAFGIGLMAFETLAYLGMRGLRFTSRG